MEKKSNNTSKLQRIVSSRNEPDDETASGNSSSKMTSSSASSQFNSQHEILKYSSNNSKLIKRHLTSSLNNVNLADSDAKVFYPNALTRKVSSNKDESIEFANANSTNAILQPNSSKTFADQQHVKPLRKIAVVNSSSNGSITANNLNAYKSHHYGEETATSYQHFQQHQQLGSLLKSSSSSNHLGHLKNTIDIENTSTAPSSINTRIPNTNILTANSWRVGEAIVQKQLKQHLKQQQQLKQHASAAAAAATSSSSNGAPASTSAVASLILPPGTVAVGDVAPIDLVTNRRHLLLAASSCQQSGNNKPSKRTEFLSIPIQQPPKSSVTKASSNNQPTTSVNVSKTTSKNAFLSSLTDSSNNKAQAKSSSLTKRIYETKSDREKLKRDDEERKRKLQEIYRKQRSTQTSELMRCKELPKLTSSSVSSSSSSSANNLISASTSLTDHSKQQQQLISNKYLYEQDMSKILQDKITHLLNDNDKLVEKQRQQFINYNKRSKQHQQLPITSTSNQFVSNELLDGISQPNEDDDDYSNEETNDETDEIETTNALRNLTNFETENKKINEQSQQQPPYVHKNDRIKKICSIALDLQTKMQQTKLKLFGMNPNDESILYYGNNVNNMTEDDYDDENQLIPSKSFQIQTQTIKSKPTSTNCAGNSANVLTPNMAARRIQIAYRKYLNRRRRYLKKNQQHHINIIKYNNMNNSDELKLKSQQQQLVKNPKLEQQLHHLHNQYNYHLVNDNENLSDDYLRKKSTNTKYSRAANQISLIKTMEQNDLIYESDYTRDDLIRNNSKKLVLNKYEINKSSLSNQSSNSSSNETVASSNSLSKYMLSLAQQQQQQQQQQQNSILLPTKKSSRSTNVSSSSSSSRASKLKSSSQNQTNTNEDESISSNSEESISTSTSSSSTNHSSSNNTTSNTLTNGSLTSLKSNKNKSYEKKSCSSPSSSTITQATSASQRSNSAAKPQLKLQNKLRSLSYTNREESIKESRYLAVPLESSNYLEGMNGSNSHAEEVSKVVFKEPARISSSLYDPTDYEILNKVNKLQLPKRSLSANASSLSTLSYLDEPESEGILNVNKRLSVNYNFNIMNKRHRESCNNIDSISDLMGSVQIGDTTSRRSTFGMGYEDDDELEKSFRALLPSESHLKKSKQLDANKEHSFIYSINDMSQTSLLSQFDNQTSIRISFEDDSFKKFTGEIVKKYMQEEEMRSKHQVALLEIRANLLKLREKALIDKTNAELTWLEQMKKKVQDKGEDEKMPSILKKEKGIMQKLKEEQENINQMKEVQRKATESRLKILSQHSEVIKWCQNKLKKQHNFSTSLIDSSDVNVSKLTCVNENDFLDSDLLLNDQPNPLDESSNINQSLIESKVMKQVKQHLNSEKYLTEREKKLRLRRKHAEEIIAWKKKLDDEELQVREIEKKANLALISKNEIANNSILNETASSQTHEKFKQNIISKTALDDESHTVSSQKIDTSSDLTLTPMNNLIALDKKNDKLKTLEPSTSILNLKKKTTKSRKEQQDETTTNKSENIVQTEKETSLKIKETIGPSVLDTKQPASLDHKVKELSQTIKSSDKSKTKQTEEIHRKMICSNECLIGKIDQLEATNIVDNHEQVNNEYQLAEKSLNNSLVKLSNKSVDICEKPTSEVEFSNKIIIESIVDELVLNEAEELLQVNLQISKKDGSLTETKQNECEQNIQQYEEDSLSNRSIKLQETTDKLIELKIPYSKKIIEYLSDLAIKDYFWKRIENNLDLKSIQQDLINDENEFVFHDNLIEYFKTNLEDSSNSQESDESKSTNKNIEMIFKKMLLDLIAELIHDLYLERNENEKSVFKYMPGMKKSFKKQYFKSFVRGPKQIKEAQLIIKNKLNGLLKLTETSGTWSKSSTQLKSKWHSHKRLDLVDSILDHEMREQEYEWSNYEQDEYEAKILISNTIFDMILKDTIDCFQFNIMNKIY